VQSFYLVYAPDKMGIDINQGVIMYEGTPHPSFVFQGSAEKIAEDKAMVSEFRRAHGMNPDPFGALVGTKESIDHQLSLLTAYKRRL
jgi:hypothetical protein